PFFFLFFFFFFKEKTGNTVGGPLGGAGELLKGRGKCRGEQRRSVLVRTDGVVMAEQWPEGPAADQELARERYDSDMRAVRGALREVLRADPSDAHLGLGIVLFASVLVGLLARPVAGALVSGSFAALFLATLLIMRLRGIRGREAGRRAYLFTFGWGRWV
ncbi:hypothetical protein, partial [Streptomyces sp. ME18-1-4]|uniref:hypothetical protein n=1 Tax=Streptomyces sp. ME18-1-4 TaxID=3028685 RepID=UPI0029B53CC2